MGRTENQKLKLLYLKELFERQSDEEHLLSMQDILDALAARDIRAERKSVYDDILCLQQFGMDIVTVKGRHGGYFLASRTFELPELKLLVDAVQSSKFLSERKSMQLIAKLETLASQYAAGSLRRQVVVKNRIKAMNESIYYLVDELHTAINGDKRIRFHYTGYDGHGRRVLRRGGAWYDVSPYALLWDDENYYLIGYDSAFSEIRHFRVDKISDLCTAGDEREGSKAFAALDMSAYTSAHFGMFSGTPENIRLECRDTLAGAVIDRFGTDTMLIPSHEGYFTVTVPVAVSAPFFGWLCSFGGDIKLLAPESAVDALREHLRKFAEAYQI